VSVDSFSVGAISPCRTSSSLPTDQVVKCHEMQSVPSALMPDGMPILSILPTTASSSFMAHPQPTVTIQQKVGVFLG
jgi:hypothetical protein